MEYREYLETLFGLQVSLTRDTQSDGAQNRFGYLDGRLQIEDVDQLRFTVPNAARIEVNVPSHILVCA